MKPPSLLPSLLLKSINYISNPSECIPPHLFKSYLLSTPPPLFIPLHHTCYRKATVHTSSRTSPHQCPTNQPLCRNHCPPTPGRGKGGGRREGGGGEERGGRKRGGGRGGGKKRGGGGRGGGGKGRRRKGGLIN